MKLDPTRFCSLWPLTMPVRRPSNKCVTGVLTPYRETREYILRGLKSWTLDQNAKPLDANSSNPTK